MSDGEKILSSIRSDSDERIAAINADADKVCTELSAKAQQRAKEIRHAAETKIQLQSEKLLKATRSRMELEKRSVMLRARRGEIDRTVGGVEEYMLSLPEKEYFGLIYKLASTLEGQSGTVLLSARDLARLPGDFKSRMKASGLDITVCDKPCDSISGGFILKNGDIEENMTFAAVISANRERIEDLISRELFV